MAREASPWVMRFAARLAPGSRVLDLACGHGRHARYLAGLGCRVTAVDVDPACGDSLASVRGVEFRCADLESGPWPFAGVSFDAIVVVHYLHRPLLPQLAAALAHGGLLIYETFAQGNERYGRPRNPDFLLRPRELLDAFSSLRVLAFEDGCVAGMPPAMIQRIAAVALEPGASEPPELLAL
ncbi:MAG TPA: class I SAM-dependent methyltransferase [Burkholderiaceae bacterium]|nr:class I SAM-dependent methyltransferase [Burkholderiaceae bacterium]